MNILGVDAGITTGVAIIEITATDWHLCLREDCRPPGEDRGEQLLGLDAWLCTHEFEEVAMEEMLAFGNNSADEKVEAQAVVKMFCARRRMPRYSYAPATVRSRVMGHGRASEREIKATLRYLLNMPKVSKKGEAFSLHQQDAVAVALCHAIKVHGLILDRQGVPCG